jgi:hypothetical protein
LGAGDRLRGADAVLRSLVRPSVAPARAVIR